MLSTVVMIADVPLRPISPHLGEAVGPNCTEPEALEFPLRSFCALEHSIRTSSGDTCMYLSVGIAARKNKENKEEKKVSET